MILSVSCHSRHTPRSSMVTSLSDCTLEREREQLFVITAHTHTHSMQPVLCHTYILHTAYKVLTIFSMSRIN